MVVFGFFYHFLTRETTVVLFSLLHWKPGPMGANYLLLEWDLLRRSIFIRPFEKRDILCYGV